MLSQANMGGSPCRGVVRMAVCQLPQPEKTTLIKKDLLLMTSTTNSTAMFNDHLIPMAELDEQALRDSVGSWAQYKHPLDQRKEPELVLIRRVNSSERVWVLSFTDLRADAGLVPRSTPNADPSNIRNTIFSVAVRDLVLDRSLPRLLNLNGQPPAGEWEEGFVYVDYDQSDTVDGYLIEHSEPVSIESQTTGEMHYFDKVPGGVAVTNNPDGTEQGDARRWVSHWES
ncbi:Hypothetical protein [Corynebacterium glutamicum ATCC 13032]|uniref:Uncharacterized protein n=2 Tax=Corynebacterium glutamicum TaxID=1718 RepID=Q8NPV1_CORGL|nr:Hypothetical protein [Corynebacterium glutamicum ATCC 13032]CAF20093.1 hypothetical protein predicted by Glimmer/Critica [Corynebacterium glutamicum ATCC 13032]